MARAAMSPFARLRHNAAGLLGRAVLAWFALTLGAAAAASWALPTALQDICTSAGPATLLPAAGTAPGGQHLNCPMCLPTAPPPPLWPGSPATAAFLSYLLQPAAHASPTARGVAVPPVRGPPAL